MALGSCRRAMPAVPASHSQRPPAPSASPPPNPRPQQRTAAALVVFCLTVARFHWRRYTLLWMFATLTYAISTATTYHVRATFFHFTFYWWAYSAIGGAVAYVCATFILPISAGVHARVWADAATPGLAALGPLQACCPALESAGRVLPPATGTIVRRRLAAALHHTSEVARRTLDLASGEVDPGTGLLAAATGETSERIGLDAGLYPALQPLYDAVMAASLACGVSWAAGPARQPGLAGRRCCRRG